MECDFARELRYLGVTARLKRLSDAFSASIKELYQANGVDLEPSWHLVLLFLKRHSTATMTEIASSLDISQPAMTKMISRMLRKGYLEVVRDETDSRKKNICLSALAVERLPVFERVWRAGQESIREILRTNPELLSALDLLENEIRRKSFKERAMERLGDD